MPDYSKAVIYSIRSHRTDDIYIGSTLQPLYKVISTYRKKYNQYVNDKDPYRSVFDILKYDDNYIELLEEVKCDNIQQLRKRQGELIRSNVNCINHNIAGRTKEEHSIDTKEHIKERMKKYNAIHRERNKEYALKYYYEHKEAILQKQSTKITCECGSNVSIVNISKHKKTKKHQEWVSTQSC